MADKRMLPPDVAITVAQRRIDFLSQRIIALKGEVRADLDKRERKALQMMATVFALTMWNIDREAFYRGETGPAIVREMRHA